MFFYKTSMQIRNPRAKLIETLLATSTLFLGTLVGAPFARDEGPTETETIKFISDHVNEKAFLRFNVKFSDRSESAICKIYTSTISTEEVSFVTDSCEVRFRGNRMRWRVTFNLRDIESIDLVMIGSQHGVNFTCKGNSSCTAAVVDSQLWNSRSFRTLLYNGASDAERVLRAFRHLRRLSSQKDQGLFSSNAPMRRKGRLGVEIRPVTDELSRERNLGIARGALVVDVADNGPAQAARIKAGDVIFDYDGRQFTDQPELISMISNTPVGKKVSLGIWRNGGKLRLDAVIGESK
jgi:hypothetical protein